MPINGCNTGVAAATALFVLLVLPLNYFVPDVHPKPNVNEISPAVLNPVPFHNISWTAFEIPPFDLFITVALLFLAMSTYVCDWIQRKLMERRIKKLNQYLTECVDRLRAWDTRQEQLEGTIKMVQNATSEYNLLLYLLLRQHRLGPVKKPPSHGFFDKDMEDINFITNPTIDVYANDDL